MQACSRALNPLRLKNPQIVEIAVSMWSFMDGMMPPGSRRYVTPGPQQTHRDRGHQSQPMVSPCARHITALVTQDENDAREISGLLGYLRELQRTFNLAIIVVHHARKRTATTPGEALRGSSDLYAWTDVTAHLSRTPQDELVLQVEHRSAASPEPVHLKLVSRPDGTRTHLELRNTPAEPVATAAPLPPTLASTLLAALACSDTPVAVETLRERVKAQKQRVTRCLEDLEKQGFVKRAGPRGGWQLAARAVAETAPRAEQLRLPLGID